MHAVISVPQPRPSSLERAAAAKAIAFAANPFDHEARAVQALADDKGAVAALTRTAQTVGQTTSGWATAFANGSLGEFLGSLVPESAAAQLINRGIRIAFKPGAEAVTIPTRSGAPTALPWRAESGAISVRQYATAGSPVLTPKSFGALSVITRELARRTDAQSVVTALLREDVGAALDAAYFSATAASSSDHPGLLNGVAALAYYPGSGAEAIAADLATLTDGIADGGSGQVVFVVSPKRAMRVSLLYPTLQATFLASAAVADDVIIAIDPVSIVHAFADEPAELETTESAVVHMDSSPGDIVSGGTPASGAVKSMFQTAAVAIRIIGTMAFGKRRSGAVSWLQTSYW